MKGDFSRWDKIRNKNLEGVLHQQGRVLIDRDWNDQTRITLDWQEQAARDIIGADLLAVPADRPQGFKVIKAAAPGGEVRLAVQTGSAWADGLPVTLAGAGTVVELTADPLGPPFQAAPAAPANGDRDAVVLEVWREALNGFQVPDQLIEPALGGPDTTERVYNAMRFRLLRLGSDDTCESVAGKVRDDINLKGRLRATLLPTTIIPGDCPTVEGGGYVGFEHFFYRVEIAQTSGAGLFFKWSQFNGGLVGRGECHLGGVNKKIDLTANDQAIKTAGLSSFYLEVVEFDLSRGAWRVTYGADVTLNGDQLDVTTERYTESALPSGRVFFRLWNELRPISDFPKVVAPTDPNELRDGIRLEFDPDNGGNYQPGDYWTFAVRAGEVGNSDPLIDDLPPEGVVYHRVPVAILNWNAALEISADTLEIEDCRDAFPPLTRTNDCCSYRVGDGRTSFGDYNSIEEALRHLPAAGGEICLLPGVHRANAVIQGRKNIKISGCERRSTVIPNPGDPVLPIFQVIDSDGIIFEYMDLVTFGGTAFDLLGTKPGALHEVEVRYTRILACQNAVHVIGGQDISIHHNQMRMLDKAGGDVAIYLLADGGLIERNELTVAPDIVVRPPADTPSDGGGDQPDPNDPCADPERFYVDRRFLLRYAYKVWTASFLKFIPKNPYQTLGGIQVGSGSTKIIIRENTINGGAGNGITLGSDLDPEDFIHVDPPPPAEEFKVEAAFESLNGRVLVVNAETPVVGVTLQFDRPGQNALTTTTGNRGEFRVRTGNGSYLVTIPAGDYTIRGIKLGEVDELGLENLIFVEKAQVPPSPLNVLANIDEVEIEGNSISNMGLSGIGVPTLELQKLIQDAQTSLKNLPRPQLVLLLAMLRRYGVINGFVTDLLIEENHIFRCWQNVFSEALQNMANLRGQGGISLGFCQDVMIRENRIEENGRNHVAPTCGVFIVYGMQVELFQNQIINNGPIDTQAGFRVLSGLRGGIVIRMAMSRSFNEVTPAVGKVTDAMSTHYVVSEALTNKVGLAVTQTRGALFKGRQAARIVDNRVEQPLGRALQMNAWGPVAVLNNQFTTDFAGLPNLDLNAAVVMIRDLGRSIVIENNDFVTPNLPNGNVLFNNNQALLGYAGGCVSSQVLISFDDIGLSGNQSDIVLAPALQINTLALAPTVRASDNRLKEPLKRG